MLGRAVRYPLERRMEFFHVENIPAADDSRLREDSRRYALIEEGFPDTEQRGSRNAVNAEGKDAGREELVTFGFLGHWMLSC